MTSRRLCCLGFRGGGGWRWSLGLLAAGVIVILTGVGCAGSQRNGESDEQVVGEPPSEEDDPFELIQRPPEAEKAPKSGYMGAEDEEAASQQKTDGEERKSYATSGTPAAEKTEETEESPARQASSEGRAEAPSADPRAESGSPNETASARSPDSRPGSATRAEPDGEERPPKGTAGNEYQCFSCIRLCALSESGQFAEADCPQHGEDVICGWGVHPEKEKARARARAECEGALELSRQMPNWSRIEGTCPEATCR